MRYYSFDCISIRIRLPVRIFVFASSKWDSLILTWTLTVSTPRPDSKLVPKGADMQSKCICLKNPSREICNIHPASGVPEVLDQKSRDKKHSPKVVPVITGTQLTFSWSCNGGSCRVCGPHHVTQMWHSFHPSHLPGPARHRKARGAQKLYLQMI